MNNYVFNEMTRLLSVGDLQVQVPPGRSAEDFRNNQLRCMDNLAGQLLKRVEHWKSRVGTEETVSLALLAELDELRATNDALATEVVRLRGSIESS